MAPASAAERLVVEEKDHRGAAAEETHTSLVLEEALGQELVRRQRRALHHILAGLNPEPLREAPARLLDRVPDVHLEVQRRFEIFEQRHHRAAALTALAINRAHLEVHDVSVQNAHLELLAGVRLLYASTSRFVRSVFASKMAFCR